MLSIFPEAYSFEKVIVMLQYYEQSRKKIMLFLNLFLWEENKGKLKILVIFKAYKWIANWIKFHSRYDTIYFNILLSY